MTTSEDIGKLVFSTPVVIVLGALAVVSLAFAVTRDSPTKAPGYDPIGRF